ncbi:type I secretion C-terminal target domain-containing protein [Pelagibius sp. 7325]|uniref:type I secretion C-terminal target domain-containing protein n=1 Tax=Pelagibius sp. 7325 TaxID=3131994 RepID=UPI0030EEA7DE
MRHNCFISRAHRWPIWLLAGDDSLRGGAGNDTLHGEDGGDTTVTIDADGAGGSGATASITLAGTDLSSLGTSDSEIIDTMLAQGNLDAV